MSGVAIIRSLDIISIQFPGKLADSNEVEISPQAVLHPRGSSRFNLKLQPVPTLGM